MAAVDIIKNGYVFSNPSFVIRVEKTLDQNGDLVNRTATNVSVKLTVPAGITAVSFTSDTSGVTCDLNTGIVTVPIVSSDNPVTCFFMFRVDDSSTAINSQWTIPISDMSGNPLFNFVFQPIIIGGLTDQDILDVVGALVGPIGPPGIAGPPNALTIGTVTEGPANAILSGLAPAQVLDLVIPKGDTGTADNITIGTVTTVAPGDPAAATITGASPNKQLNLAIPQGETGVGGEMNVQADWDEADNLNDAYIKNKPVIPAAQVNSDWNAVGGVEEILNKPTIPTLVSQLANDTGFITATLTQEQVQDFMSSALAHAFHTDVSVVYNDAANRFEITAVGSGADGTITNMVRSGDNLVVTGSLGSFSGTLTNIFKDTIFDAQRVGNILEWYVDGVKIKDINLCCTVTKADVGLGNVPNVDATLRANHTGTQAQSTIVNLVADLAGKQQNLISGTNIKTINNQSILGSGNLDVSLAEPITYFEKNTGTGTLGVSSYSFNALATGFYRVTGTINVQSPGSDRELVTKVIVNNVDIFEYTKTVVTDTEDVVTFDVVVSATLAQTIEVEYRCDPGGITFSAGTLVTWRSVNAVEV